MGTQHFWRSIFVAVKYIKQVQTQQNRQIFLFADSKFRESYDNLTSLLQFHTTGSWELQPEYRAMPVIYHSINTGYNMNNIKIKAAKLSMIIAGAMITGIACAAPAPDPTWTPETSSIDTLTSPGFGSITLDGSTFTFTDAVAAPVQLAYYNGNPQGGDSQDKIATLIKNSGMFGLTPTTVLTNSVTLNSFSGGAVATPTGTLKPYDFLAVHFGGGELLFHWSQPVSDFSITGSGLSNYRAFTSAVPEPETYGMLLAGLGLVGFLARRRKAA